MLLLLCSLPSLFLFGRHQPPHTYPPPHTHTNVAGSGLALLAKVNTMGEFSGNPTAKSNVVPINRDVRREVSSNGHFKVKATGEIEQMKVDAVLERREMRSKNSAWNDHVEGLGCTTQEALNAKKAEYEARRQYMCVK